MFVNIAAQFVTHRRHLKSDLQFYINVMSGVLRSIDNKISVMTSMVEMVFEEMQSPKENRGERRRSGTGQGNGC